MASVGLIPAIALIVGAACGTFTESSFTAALWSLPPLCVTAIVAWRRQRSWITVVLLIVTSWGAGAVLAARAREHALHPSLRTLLDDEFGGFAIDEPGPEGRHEPLLTRAVLTEDAARREDFVTARARVTAISLRGQWRAANGEISLTVTGSSATARWLEWRAGRSVAAPMTFGRPARYLNDGVPDFERDLALNGTSLFGSVKSGLLVDVVGYGHAIEEAAADVRALVRRAVRRWVSPHDAVAGAIVTAVLIGDRTGLPDAVRDRLQAAGIYHVIAISGGNIAILAALALGTLMLTGIQGRAAALVTIVVLLGYSQVASAGPSVWRATLMAVLYLGARCIDHRTPPWQAASVAAALMVTARPLDIRDPGFILTFGATAALLEGARRARERLSWHPPSPGGDDRTRSCSPRGNGGRRRMVAWGVASLTASLAVEIALLPVSAQMFSRVTSAGLVLNLIAVPMMAIAQVAGLAVVALDALDVTAWAAGWAAYAGAAVLVASSRLVDEAPWLATRVPPPGLALVLTYYVALAVLLLWRGFAVRVYAGIALLAVATIICGFNPTWVPPSGGPGSARAGSRALLRWTTFDVGQGEAMLVEPPHGGALLVDAGGAPFGTGSFDIGARVVVPALWARGVRSLEALLVTHGDPDHLGGGEAVLEDFRPGRLWEGIRVLPHMPMRELRDAAMANGSAVEVRRAGQAFDWGGARVRVLHPPEPDWERPRVRNDDSVVLEIVHGDVALLLSGDIGADVERAILPQLTPARTRILKVPHHGSRTSTSQELLDAWRPQIAVISCGRGNTFGHPAPDVLRRLESIGAQILRTDLHGQITVETDGHRVRVGTYTGARYER